MNLPMDVYSNDLVVHSEVLEHVPAALTALREAYRVLRPGGFTCYTIPLLVTRLTTGTEGKPPTFHGSEAETDEGLMVRTEYGADAWAQAAQAGFHEVRLFPLRHPAAVAI